MEAELELAVVQLSSQDDVAQNLDTCAKLVAAAAQRGARVVVLPENFAYFGPESGRRQHAERLGDVSAPIQSALSRIARESACHVVAGGMPIKSTDPERPYNGSPVFDPSGALLETYSKIHLFDVDLADGTSLRESASTLPGAEPRSVKLAGFEFGLSICYDLRFPEPCTPARIIGMRSCARGPSKISATSPPPRNGARTRTAARPTATR
jgi:predicted amidohydrolase